MQQKNQLEIYVSAINGNDTNDGMKKSPFKTIKRSQEEVRKFNDNMTDDIIVYLEGNFEISETLIFTADDSGKNGFSVIYRGERGKTSISGGKKITGWQKVEGTELYKAKANTSKPFRQFYINGNRGVRSKSQWMYYPIDTYKDPESKWHKHCDYDGYILSGTDFPEEFSFTEGMEAIWLPSWKNVRIPVEEFYRREDGNYVMKLKQPTFDSIINTSAFPKTDYPFYFENTPEFLDEPGEWYYNKNTDEIFYIPTENENMDTDECYIPLTEGLVSIKGDGRDKPVSNIIFENIVFKYGAWEKTVKTGFATIQAETMICPKGEPGSSEWEDEFYDQKRAHAQIDINYAENISLKCCTFTHLGSIAVAYANVVGGEIIGNIFDDISSGAIVLGNDPLDDEDDFETYTRDLVVSNNILRRVAVEYMTPQITLYHGNNIKINHNDILDAPYTGISYGWGWGRNVPHHGNCEICYNRIENVLYKTKDGSHIYNLDKAPGTLIKGNFCRKSGEWKGGIYLDNSSEDLEITENVFDCYKWLKITYFNIKNNVGYKNYSVRPGVNFFDFQNKIDEAIPIDTDENKWPEEVKAIVSFAGLENDYQYLYKEYEDNKNFRNAELHYLKYHNHPGIIISAGDYMEGGEGIAYHNILHIDEGMAIDGEPSFIDTYNGTGQIYIMTTAEGEWLKYRFETEEDAEYDIFIRAAAVKDGVKSTVFIDDEIVADKAPIKKNCDNYLTFDENYICRTFIKKGQHILKVLQAEGNYDLYDFRLTKVGEKLLVRNDGFRKNIMAAIK